MSLRTVTRAWPLIGALLTGGAACTGSQAALPTCEDGRAAAAPHWDVELPRCTDWTDRGEMFARGNRGDWDHYLSGGFAGTVVKKDGRFLLYYQGAQDYSEQYGTVTHRAIGVATSTDGLSFRKSRRNPVLAWSPHRGIEEGAVSGGAALDDAGRVVMTYGANTQQNDRLVNADGRMAVSEDGFDFVDTSLALAHADPNLWGSGDEVFPIATIVDRGRTFVYYIPNGTPQRGRLGVAWGQGYQLRSSAQASAAGAGIAAWGMAGYAMLAPRTYALFLNRVDTPQIEVRIVDLDRPQELSSPVIRYVFEDFTQGTIYLDHETRTWYLYHRTGDAAAYRVKTAPVHPRG